VATNFAQSVVSSYGINVKIANRLYLSQIATVKNVEPKILITIPVQHTEQDKTCTQTNALLQKKLFLQLKPTKDGYLGIMNACGSGSFCFAAYTTNAKAQSC
jgi:hypothetical protein